MSCSVTPQDEQKLVKVLTRDRAAHVLGSQFFDALRNDIRCRIIVELSKGPKSFKELLSSLGLNDKKKPLLHYHLMILHRAKLIETHLDPRDLRRRYYLLTDEGRRALELILKSASKISEHEKRSAGLREGKRFLIEILTKRMRSMTLVLSSLTIVMLMVLQRTLILTEHLLVVDLRAIIAFCIALATSFTIVSLFGRKVLLRTK